MIGDFKTRSLETERLDRGEFTDAEFRRWQKEMWFIHRLFGETRALRKSVLREINSNGTNRVYVLDVAAGSGGLLNFLRYASRGKNVSYYGIEMSPDSARSIARNGNIAVRGDALSLPFADASIDIAFCTLFLHHLNQDDAITMLRELRRVSRRKFFVIDLDRRILPYLAYKFLGRFLLQRFTRQDGALSIKRAYRADELRKIAQRSGLEQVSIERSAVGRLILSAEAGDA